MFKFFNERNITKLKDQDLHLVKGDFVELLPGITAVKADGHTPGQIALVIQSGKEHLDWQTNYDLDQVRAKQTRIKLIDLAYKENMLVNAFHFDFPGLGRIEMQDARSHWNYTKL